MQSDVSPIILAAGASTRMGRPKALCDFDGRTCLELSLDACRGLGTPIVVLGPAREEIQKRVDLSRVQIVLNEDYESGQTSSLKAGLTALPPSARAFLILPMDHPLIGVEEVDAVVSAWRGNRDDTKKIFVPSYSLKRGHPVLCEAGIAADFLSLPDDAPARTVMNHQMTRIRYVNVEKPFILMDMDTPEDYEKCLDMYRARRREEAR